MTDPIYGFVEVQMTDHETALYLRCQHALHNWASQGNSTTWRGDNDRAVLVIFYGGTDGTGTRRMVPSDLVREVHHFACPLQPRLGAHHHERRTP